MVANLSITRFDEEGTKPRLLTPHRRLSRLPTMRRDNDMIGSRCMTNFSGVPYTNADGRRLITSAIYSGNGRVAASPAQNHSHARGVTAFYLGKTERRRWWLTVLNIRWHRPRPHFRGWQTAFAMCGRSYRRWRQTSPRTSSLLGAWHFGGPAPKPGHQSLFCCRFNLIIPVAPGTAPTAHQLRHGSGYKIRGSFPA